MIGYLNKKLKTLLMSCAKFTPVNGCFSDENIVKLNSRSFTLIGDGICPNLFHSSFRTFSIPIPKGAKKVTVNAERSAGFTTGSYKLGYGIALEPVSTKDNPANIIATTSLGEQSFTINLKKYSGYRYVVASVYTSGVNVSGYKFIFE